MPDARGRRPLRHLSRGVDDPRMARPGAAARARTPAILQIHDPAKFGCTICHQGQGRASDRRRARRRAALGGPAAARRFIRSPAARNATPRPSCTATTDCSPQAQGDSARIRRPVAAARARPERLLRERGCLGCHSSTAGGTLGPELTYVGDKGGTASTSRTCGHDAPRRVEWLNAHFMDPARFARARSCRRSATDDDAEALAAYMLSLRAAGAWRYRYRPCTAQPRLRTPGRDGALRSSAACLPRSRRPAAACPRDPHAGSRTTRTSSRSPTTTTSTSSSSTAAAAPRCRPGARARRPARATDRAHRRLHPRLASARRADADLSSRRAATRAAARASTAATAPPATGSAARAASARPELRRLPGGRRRPLPRRDDPRRAPGNGHAVLEGPDVAGGQRPPGLPAHLAAPSRRRFDEVAVDAWRAVPTRQNARDRRLSLPHELRRLPRRRRPGRHRSLARPAPTSSRASTTATWTTPSPEGGRRRRCRPGATCRRDDRRRPDRVPAQPLAAERAPTRPRDAPRAIYAVGEVYYQRACIGCHGERRVGGIGPQLRNPVFLGSVSDGSLYESIAPRPCRHRR